jgi:hypothetical protein
MGKIEEGMTDDKPLTRLERNHLGVDRNEKTGETRGKDPREIPRNVLGKIGHEARPLLSVIRAKCLDCSQTASEVLWCTATSCALWPYRMGTNPLRAEKTEAQKAAAIESGKRLANRKKNPHEAPSE